ncbi:DUF5998 family protein [Myceligenerans pegani]
MPTAPAAEMRKTLNARLHRAGYYPQLVADLLEVALAGEDVVAHLVQAETTFDSEVRRHLTVLVLTPTRLITAHVDDQPADEDDGRPGQAAATTEAVPLKEVRSVGLTHIIGEPEKHPDGASRLELNLAIGWGGAHRIDLEPATCGDPNCTADHGLTGQSLPDDVVVRVSSAAEGNDAVRAATEFAEALSRATAA